MADQYEMQNPLTQYPAEDFPKQRQPAPGVQAEMRPVPDCGEKAIAAAAVCRGVKRW